jgi:hypothetical protein
MDWAIELGALEKEGYSDFSNSDLSIQSQRSSESPMDGAIVEEGALRS